MGIGVRDLQLLIGRTMIVSPSGWLVKSGCCLEEGELAGAASRLRRGGSETRPYTMAISSSVKPYKSETSASISPLVASIWRC